MPWRNNVQPDTKEKIAAGLSYLTFGIAGLLYVLLGKSGRQSDWFRFHFVQSILLWIIASMLGMAAPTVIDILGAALHFIPGGAQLAFLQGVGIFATILTNIFRLVLIYGALWAFLGKSCEVPLISPVVRNNMR